IVSFSGDKLLGGPQAGILAGESLAITRCRRHPMARALRPGKLALAALHATALAHARTVEIPALPVHEMIAVSLDALRERGRRLCAALGWPEARIVDSEATIGGGSLPGETMASVALVIDDPRAHHLAASLREGEPPLLARVHEQRLWIDLRTLHHVDDERLREVLRKL
ncbi:MAG: L-seryl-tRNA(Sec) selenium transferase, partial [Myxococcales bacterium]|nr:L-seryl-tRNA(Sec) selenium transferase [Myxococcales bacterium]